MLIKKNIFVPFLLLAVPSFGQNIISNSNFETYSACPTSVAQLPNCTGWMNVSGHGGSADYINACSTSTLVDVPGNAFGNQAAFSGNGYIGFAMYYQSTANFREYVQKQFISPMVAGQTYTIQFQASLSDNSQYSAPCFQFYFSNAPLTWSGGGWGPITSVTPQLSSTNHITSKTAWTTFTDVYTATGGEQYVTMGNYRNDASTPGITPAGPGSYSTVYYYIEDFTITPGTPLPAEVINFDLECNTSAIDLKWSTASETNCDYFTVESSTDGINFIIDAQVDGAGNSNEIIDYQYSYTSFDNKGPYFRIGQVDIDGNTHHLDARTIECTEEEINLCPVVFENNNQINLEMSSSESDIIGLEIIDYSGRIINKFSKDIQSGKNILQISDSGLSTGIYLLVVISSKGKCITRFMHQQ